MQATPATTRLARLLAGSPTPDDDASGMDFAERLSQWVGAFDAIRLQGAHRDVEGIRSAAPGRVDAGRVPVDEEFRQVRDLLARAASRDPMDDVLPGEPPFACFQRRHLELQRQMEQTAGALRERARELLGRASARLRQLAELDAAMEQLLAPRQQGLAGGALRALERQFKKQRTEAEPGWEVRFTEHWREVVLAEMDLRLSPAAGLVAALRNERNTTTS